MWITILKSAGTSLIMPILPNAITSGDYILGSIIAAFGK